ncbi:hypothetical protein BT69DRAFT_1306626, partial [Atractiella rhizophila]
KRLASLEREFESTRQELRNAEKELQEFKSKRDLAQRKGARKSMDQPATFKQRSKIFSSAKFSVMLIFAIVEFEAHQIKTGWTLLSASDNYIEALYAKELLCRFNIDAEQRVEDLKVDLAEAPPAQKFEGQLKILLFNRLKTNLESGGCRGQSMKEIAGFITHCWNNCLTLVKAFLLAYRRYIIRLTPLNDTNAFLQFRVEFVSRTLRSGFYVLFEIGDEDLMGDDPVGAMSCDAVRGPGENKVDLKEVVYIIRDGISAEVPAGRNPNVLAKTCRAVENKFP